MASEALNTAFQSLKIGRSAEEDNVFIKLSLCGWRITAPSPATTSDQSPPSNANPFAAPWTKNWIQPTDLIEAKIASLNLNQAHEPDPLFLCSAGDCPLQDRVHTQGYFVATPGRGVIRHPDFGISDPPARIWAAYFRHTGYTKEIGDHCRTVQDFIDLLIQRPFDDSRPEDAAIVLNFLRYHAIDLRQGGNNTEVVPLRGRVLSQVEPEMVGSMGTLAL
ncbi:MAG: hypothetical protein LQ343_005945 [Gyalolechia ehrenbergii]|nr:MAG: hypothetical protein LQ343_005945 [Gyalolechia ehrenbergii]